MPFRRYYLKMWAIFSFSSLWLLVFAPPFGANINTHDLRCGQTTFSMNQLVLRPCGGKQTQPKKCSIHKEVNLGRVCVCVCVSVSVSTSGSICVSSLCAAMALKSSKTFNSTAQIAGSFQALMPSHLLPHWDQLWVFVLLDPLLNYLSPLLSSCRTLPSCIHTPPRRLSFPHPSDAPPPLLTPLLGHRSGAGSSTALSALRQFVPIRCLLPAC